MIEELRRHGYEMSPGTIYPLPHSLHKKGSAQDNGNRLRAFRVTTFSGEKTSPRRAPKRSLLPLSPRRTQVRLIPLLYQVSGHRQIYFRHRGGLSSARVYRLRLKQPAPTLSPSLGGPLYLNPQPVSFLAALALPGLLPRVALLALRFRFEKYAQHTFSTETEGRKKLRQLPKPRLSAAAHRTN
jgi:hypothetical protein